MKTLTPFIGSILNFLICCCSCRSLVCVRWSLASSFKTYQERTDERGMDKQYSSISLHFLGNQAKTLNWASVLIPAQTCTLEGIWKHYYFLGLVLFAVLLVILASTEVLKFDEFKVCCKPLNPSFQPVGAEKLEKSCLSIRILNACDRWFWIPWLLLSCLSSLKQAHLIGQKKQSMGRAISLKRAGAWYLSLPFPLLAECSLSYSYFIF